MTIRISGRRRLFRTAENDAGGADGEERAVGNDAALTGWYLHVIDKGARVAVVVAQHVAELPVLVAADVERAVVVVNAGIDGLEGGVDGVALLVAANDVVAHAQVERLLVVEDVLYDDDAAVFARGLGVELCTVGLVLLTLCGTQLGHADADAELLAALRALEHQRLTSLVLGLVEGNKMVTFWTAYSFHVSNL